MIIRLLKDWSSIIPPSIDANRTAFPKSKSIVVFGVLASLYSLDCAFISPLIRVFDVDVYLNADPPCAITHPKSIVVTVSPFKTQVLIGDVIAALAIKAGEAREKFIYAMKIDSFIPNEGVVATTTMSSCLEQGAPPSDLGFLTSNASLLSLVTERARFFAELFFFAQAPRRWRSHFLLSTKTIPR